MFSHASMNRAYALVWNEKQQAYVPAPETARSSGKRAGTVLATAIAALFASGAALALEGGALPGGGRVVAGQATIDQSGSKMTIDQNTGKAVIDWQNFNIGRDASVTFRQPSTDSIALNRVVGQDPTQILGRLGANGQVFIVNPNGVLFGAGAQVNAAGVLASTRDIGNSDFMAGRMHFSGGSSASVVNEGSIHSGAGGYVALIGAQVINKGTLAARGGDVRMAAADQVTLKIDGAGLASFAVERGALDALVANHGLIKADGGRIYLTADALSSLARAVVNNDGVVEAHTVENRGGTIVLKGDMSVGHAVVGGKLDASAPNGGNGGFVDTSAAHVNIRPDAQVSTAAGAGKSGTWLIDPTDFTIAASGGDMSGAQVEAALSGGNVVIQSISGAANGAGDIHVNDVVSWSSNALTLSAQNNININANLNGSGTAQLALEYGQGALAAGNASIYALADGVKVSLPSGNNLSLKLGSDGAATPYYVINSLGADGSLTGTDLQGIRGNLAGNYALGADIDASATAGRRGGMGFHNLGSNGDQFTGNLEGLGHTIDALTQDTVVGYIGLIGELAAGSKVSNLHLTNVDIQGGLMNVGAVVSKNLGTIDNVSVTGTVAGDQFVGGVVGTNTGTIRNATVNATVTGVSNYVGGIVGSNTGSVSAVTSSGSVSGVSNVGGLMGYTSTALNGLSSSATITGIIETGGLVGRADAAVSNSFATGNVNGGDSTGGLIGHATAPVTASHASGNVTGGSDVGGLIGEANGNVTGTYATGTVDGSNSVGGLIGRAYGDSGVIIVSDANASGTVTGNSFAIGGLIGTVNLGQVENGHASGNVVGNNSTGGLIGSLVGSYGRVADSDATGTVTGSNNIGGLIGEVADNCNPCTIQDSHASGTVSATGFFSGGLIGSNVTADVLRAYATGDVNGYIYAGGLSGSALNVTDSYATGAVHAYAGGGGLVGQEKMGGVITNSHATGNVSVLNAGQGGSHGGLVGENSGTITGASYATGVVTGATEAGGLVGTNENDGVIDDAHTGHNGVVGGLVSGDTRTGGLVGHNRGAINNAHSTGNVQGAGSNTGGLVGYNRSSGTIANSTVNGVVIGNSYTGGVVGHNIGSVESSVHQTGSVIGNSWVGGLVGFNTGNIGTDASATLAVTGTGDYVGGLVGNNSGTIGARAHSSAQVQGNDQVGGLVGLNWGAIADATVSGGSVQGHDQVGGLIGSHSGGDIQNATISATVSGNDAVGGFAGNIASGSVLTRNHASGDITAVSNAGGFVGTNAATLSGNAIDGNNASGTVSVSSGMAGGFAGSNSGAIADVTSTNTVSSGANAAADIGGIVGVNTGMLHNSHAANAVNATMSDAVGGAVGRNAAGGVITATFATNAVSGNNAVGGLVGDNAGDVQVAYSAGTVQGVARVGGLIGQQSGGTDNAYSTAFVNGVSEVGGLIGRASGTVAHTYASGSVTASGARAGGLIGSNSDSTISTSYYSVDGTGQTHSSGDFAGSGEVAEGKTSAQLRLASTFADWDLSSTGSHDKVWRSYDNLAAPLLTWWLTPLTITANGPANSYAYNGRSRTDVATGLSYTETLSPGHLLGTAAYATGKDVGVYTTLGGNYSDQQGYDISYVNNGSLTITQAQLVASLADFSKVYDGNVDASGASLVLSGFADGEGASTSLTGLVFNSKNVAEANSVSGNLSPLVANGNTLLGNYILPSLIVSGNGRITQKTLTVEASAGNKVYDGSRAASVTALTSGVVDGDSVAVSVSGLFADKNAGSGKLVDVAASLQGADAGNYIVGQGLTARADIARKAIAVNASVADKVYDGNTHADVSVTADDIVSGDSLQLRGDGRFADKNAGSGKTVAVGIVSSGADAGNYSFETNVAANASIRARALTVRLQGPVRKIADETTAAALTGANYVVDNVVPGETVQINEASGSYDSAAAGRGKTVTVQLGADDYSAGADTLLSNYVLPTGELSGDVGVIASAELPREVQGALASLPVHATQIEGRMEQPAVSTAGGLARLTAEDDAVVDPMAPAPSSALSAITRENLSMRRAFSIGDGGMRLPRGVQGSDKDAAE